MKKKSVTILGTAMLLSAAIFAGSASAEEETGFVIPYPTALQETMGESLTLEQEPEKIVCLSNSALQVLVRCEIKPVAITSTSTSISYPDWVEELPIIETGMSELDAESVIAMEPDLLIMGNHLQEDYGAIFDDAGIPVYYTSEGPSVTYQEVKDETLVLTGAFGGEELADTITAEFEAVEQRAAEFTESHESQQMMILFAAPPSYQQTSMGYLGSMLAMLPFENLSDELIGAESRTAPLDMEKLVELDPEIIFAIAPAVTAEDLAASYQEEFTNNPEVWQNLQAVENDRIIYLSSGDYVSSKGLYVIESMNALIDLLEEKL